MVEGRASTAVAAPTFVIGGAAKSGTTTLTELLAAHPRVHVCPRKESHHYLFRDRPPTFAGPGDDVFAAMVVSDRQEWRDLLAQAGPVAQVGESAVYYLYRPDAWPVLADELGPDGRVVLVLRDPVARITSAWGHLVRDGREPLDLADALDAEDERVAAGWEWAWHLRRVSRYHEQLPAAYDAFGASRVLVADFEELRRSPAALLARVHRFLGVEPHRAPELGRQANPSGVVRSRRLHRFLTEPHDLKDRLRPLVPDAVVQAAYRRALARNLRPLPPVPPALRALLAAELAPVGREVQRLTGLDTSAWCRP